MKKVLIIQQIIPHYRIPIFNELSKKYELTIAAEKFEEPTKYNFSTVSIALKQIGPITSIENFKDLAIDSFYAVIFLFNIRFIDLYKILIFSTNRRYKLILWGIGVSSENGYDNNHRFDEIRYWAAKKADAIVFYSKDPIEKYASKGVSKTKMFVANNTLALESNYFLDDKKYFLFVGTLKKYKKIDLLVEVYFKAFQKNENIPHLHIIGAGEYLDELRTLIKKLALEDKVALFGAINDPEILKNHYKNAIASLSPYQAGLSVLQSLSMGVPFITNFDAVTGGERFNIIDGYNGYLIKNEEQLISVLINLGNEPKTVKELGLNAFNYFNDNCSVENMVIGFVNAIES